MTELFRIVFAGTPDFAVPALRRLTADGHHIVAVYAQPDRPAGRGRRVRAGPVKAAAEELALPVRQPSDFRNEAERRTLRELAPDVMIVAAYGLLLPRAVLDIPRRGCVNIHASLLPRWRGAAPIQRAILAGDRETGVSLMRMEAGLDTGPVIDRRATPIADTDTGGSIHDRLAALGAELVSERLSAYMDGTVVPQPQPAYGAVHAPKLDKREAEIDWSEPADAIVRRIRAFDPWPVAHTASRVGMVRLWSAHTVADTSRDAEPGTVLAASADGVDVMSGRGVVRLTALQAPGRRRQLAAEFVNGRRMATGDRLG